MFRDGEKVGDDDYRQPRRWLTRKFGSVLLCAIIFFMGYSYFGQYKKISMSSNNFHCQEYERVRSPNFHVAKHIFSSEEVIESTIAKLQRAVRIPTEIQDSIPDPSLDPDNELWKPFKEFHDQLREDFPKVFSTLEVETVNTYGLLITWKGSDEELKPVMFAAHMDVVPVNRHTWDEWDHPPFSGERTHDSEQGDLIWGRGAFDDKNMLIGILQALEYILTEEPEFNPSRGIVVALGFDEESGGRRGAQHLGHRLLEKYGPDGIYSIIDEGLNGISKKAGIFIASVGTGEKGYLDVWFNLTTPGGHSSVPPEHTAIGIAAELIHEIEKYKFPLLFTDENPMTTYYRCVAENSDWYSPSLKQAFADAVTDRRARHRVTTFLVNHGGALTQALLGSTKAVDIINGGMKSNALPESVSFLVNSRIAVESSIDEVLNIWRQKTLDLARAYNIGVEFLGEELLPTEDNGFFNISIRHSLPPAPVSPNNRTWRELAGTLKSFYEGVFVPYKFGEEHDIIISPSIMTGNTDTVWYWELTKNIYRYQPGMSSDDTLGTIHSVNEHVSVDTVMSVVSFIYEYIHVTQANNHDA